MDDERASLPGPATDARATIARLAVDTLPRLIDRLTRSELAELEVREDGWRIRLRRANGVNASDGPPEARPPETRDRGRHSSGPGPTSHPDRVAGQRGGTGRRMESERGLVTSPAVGYFVARQGVSVGGNVAKGDVIGQVDVLGVSQEVVSPIDGTIGRFEVEPGQAIEFGQPVARVDVVGSRVAAVPTDDDQPVMGQLVEA